MLPTSDLSTEEKLALLDQIASGEERFLADYSGLLESFLGDRAPEVRLSAIQLLWEYPEPRFVDRLIQATSDSTPEVRLAAIHGLGRHVYEGDISDEPFQSGPWEAINAPIRRAGQRAVEFLAGIYRDSERAADERLHALEALGFSHEPEILALIADAYAYGDNEFKKSAIVAMGHNKQPRWEPVVLDELESKEPGIRLEAVRAAGEMNLSAAAPVLMRYARRGNVPRSLRLWAIYALGQTGAPAALSLLERLSISSDEELATTARAALDEWYFAVTLTEDDELLD